MAQFNIQDFIEVATGYVLVNLLQDECQVYPMTRTNDGSGGYTETRGAYRTYLNSDIIPCRFNQTRQYRDAAPFLEETTITDYYMDMPTNFELSIDDRIEHGGLTYEIRKLSDDSTWRTTKRAYVVSVR